MIVLHFYAVDNNHSGYAVGTIFLGEPVSWPSQMCVKNSLSNRGRWALHVCSVRDWKYNLMNHDLQRPCTSKDQFSTSSNRSTITCDHRCLHDESVGWTTRETHNRSMRVRAHATIRFPSRNIHRRMTVREWIKLLTTVVHESNNSTLEVPRSRAPCSCATPARIARVKCQGGRQRRPNPVGLLGQHAIQQHIH